MCVDCCLSGKNTYREKWHEKWAADEFRSTNGQLQWIINEALRKSGRLKKAKKRPADEDPADEAEGKTPEKE